MIQNPKLSDSNLGSSEGSKHQNRKKEGTHRLNLRAIDKIDDPTEAERTENLRRSGGAKTLQAETFACHATDNAPSALIYLQLQFAMH
ncbi:LOW QUALITY PROTEIN: uncharacterized protein LOC110227891 [Arabidopsis lyrata subsp. lyrata]|uniref:LOW QUALITY PROTEIN: uncharacterized protein LOC110227891 n=1 Tax=Arabidopsis lyrata subsp. lyrata TaxID=81972 RepID=UPI000A29C675|nr:LOW QUALITY PROTEIN: uncharacterized protein LOC110227891 [Arabidopsis lyrata subsp. lyrata]|eukprot:XP_020879509.1 LOW QUALITY PROTEIN: uncharacterized protein LOC110227891 [Arabidopsis lyrata subsp. lyrata]